MNVFGRCSPVRRPAPCSTRSRRTWCCRPTAFGCCAFRTRTPPRWDPATPPRRTSPSPTTKCCGESCEPPPPPTRNLKKASAKAQFRKRPREGANCFSILQSSTINALGRLTVWLSINLFRMNMNRECILQRTFGCHFEMCTSRLNANKLSWKVECNWTVLLFFKCYFFLTALEFAFRFMNTGRPQKGSGLFYLKVRRVQSPRGFDKQHGNGAVLSLCVYHTHTHTHLYITWRNVAKNKVVNNKAGHSRSSSGTTGAQVTWDQVLCFVFVHMAFDS